MVVTRLTLKDIDGKEYDFEALPRIGYNNDSGESKSDQRRNVIELYKILYTTAYNTGILIIILKYMTGETRVVTEVLDTRSDSFDN